MNWLSEFAGLIFGSCTPKEVQEVAQALDIEDTAARDLQIDMPDLEGGRLLGADPAKCVLYFESLCSLLKLEVTIGGASKLSFWPWQSGRIIHPRLILLKWAGYGRESSWAKSSRRRTRPRLLRVSLHALHESDLQIFDEWMEESPVPGGLRQVNAPPGAAE
jgi:hypothetical protein